MGKQTQTHKKLSEKQRKLKKESLKQDMKEYERVFTDDVFINMGIKLLIGALIFYLTYSFYISTLLVTDFVKLSLIVFFEQLGDIFSGLVAYLIMLWLFNKLQHIKKNYTELNGKFSLRSLLFEILNLTLNAILILVGFYVLLKSSFSDDIGLLVLFYTLIRLTCVLIAFIIAKVLSKRRSSRMIKFFIAITILFYVCILGIAIFFIFV